MPKTTVDAVEATIRDATSRVHQADTSRVTAAQERARPACELARAALPQYDAFEVAHGPTLRHRVALLRAPELARVEGVHVLLEEARAQGADLLAVLANAENIHRQLAAVEGLRPADVDPAPAAAFLPDLTFTLITRLTESAQSVDALPWMLQRFEESWARLGRALERQRAVLPDGGVTAVDEDPAPRAPRFAGGSLRRDA
jgi:hypothetical protein